MKNNFNKIDYDILIVGGGLVGASLALGLSQLSLKIGLVDSSYSPEMPHLSDGRTIALSATSCKILKALCFDPREKNLTAHSLRETVVARSEATKQSRKMPGLPRLANNASLATTAKMRGSEQLQKNNAFDSHFIDKLFHQPIKTIHISEQNRFSITRLNASDVGLPELGYSIEMNAIVRFLYEQLAKKNCVLISAQVKDAKREAASFEVSLKDKTINTKLLVAADGDHSFLRGLMKIPIMTHDYGQSAFVTTVEITGEHASTAFERFIPKGSIALLPMAEKKMKLIWVGSTDAVNALAQLPHALLLSKLQEHMGRRLGRFHTLAPNPFIYPLKFRHTSHQMMPNFVLMGNAAHTLHPIAAQGFNLSLRDIAVFVEAIRQALLDEKEIGSEEILQDYLAKRLSDQKWAERLTHGLASWFMNDFGLAAGVRNVAFNALEYLPFIKRKFIERAIGCSTALPRWVYRTD